MRLCKISLQHFRAYGEKVSLNIDEAYTTILGPNDAGKSTVLKAIEMVLGGKKPKKEDFFGGDTSKEIEIIVDFSNVTEEEKGKPAISKIVFDGDKIRLRALYSFDDKEKVNSLYSSWGESLPRAWVERQFSEFNKIEKKSLEQFDKDTGKRSSTTKSNFAGTKNPRRFEYAEWLRVNGKLDVEVETENDWKDNVNFSNEIRQGVPDVVFVPAVRSVESELSSVKSSGGAFYKILNKVMVPFVEKTGGYGGISESVKKIKDEVLADKSDISSFFSKVNDQISNVIGESSSARIEVGDVDAEKMFSSFFRVVFGDSVELPADYQGHGVQSSLIFSLMEALAEFEGGSSGKGTILLFEEPELYLHPHLMRKLCRVLKTVGQKNAWQVIITTHSPFLVDVAEKPTSMAVIRKDEKRSPFVSQLKEDPFDGDDKRRLRATLDFHPTVCEAFFAKRVVLVEGDSEVAMLSKAGDLKKCLGLRDDYVDGTTVVDCEGKWTIVAMAKVVDSLGIDYVVVHDLDNVKFDESISKIMEKENVDREKAIDMKRSKNGANPYFANDVIKSVCKKGKVVSGHNCIEDLVFGKPPSSSKDKPFKVWKEMSSKVESGEISRDSDIGRIFIDIYS